MTDGLKLFTFTFILLFNANIQSKYFNQSTFDFSVLGQLNLLKRFLNPTIEVKE
jgi:hypothetical protein